MEWIKRSSFHIRWNSMPLAVTMWITFRKWVFRLCSDSKWKVDWQKNLISNWKCADLQFDILKCYLFHMFNQQCPNDERWLDMNWLNFNFPLRFIVDFLPIGSPLHRRSQRIRFFFVYFDSHRKLYHSTHVRVPNAPWKKN